MNGRAAPYAALRMPIGPNTALLVSYHQPMHWDANYSAFTNTVTDNRRFSLTANAMTALASYEFQQGYLLLGGASLECLSAHYSVPSVTTFPAYDVELSGYAARPVLGLAYDYPASGTHLILTYQGEIQGRYSTTEISGSSSLPTLVTDASAQVVLPQSITLDLRTEPTSNLALFAQGRWVEYNELEITPSSATTGLIRYVPVGDMADDIVTASIGFEYTVTSDWALGAFTGYQNDVEGAVSWHNPTSGYRSFGLTAAYAPTTQSYSVFAQLERLSYRDIYLSVPNGLSAGDYRFEGNTDYHAQIGLEYRF